MGSPILTSRSSGATLTMLFSSTGKEQTGGLHCIRGHLSPYAMYSPSLCNGVTRISNWLAQVQVVRYWGFRPTNWDWIQSTPILGLSCLISSLCPVVLTCCIEQSLWVQSQRDCARLSAGSS